MKLYHLTSREWAREILKSGFKPGDDGLVWFARHPAEVWGSSDQRVLLTTDLPEEVVSPFAEEYVCDEDWDPETKSWVKGECVAKGFYYALPPHVANTVKPRRVPNSRIVKMVY